MIAEQVLATFATCPIPEVARLGKTLKQWREAFLGYVEEAAFRNDRQGVEEQTAVFARRRQRARVRQDRGSEAERRARAKAWVKRLQEELAAGR